MRRCRSRSMQDRRCSSRSRRTRTPALPSCPCRSKCGPQGASITPTTAEPFLDIDGNALPVGVPVVLAPGSLIVPSFTNCGQDGGQFVFPCSPSVLIDSATDLATVNAITGAAPVTVTSTTVIERFCFFPGERQNLLNPRGVRNVSNHLRFRTVPHLFFDLHPDGFEIEIHGLKNVHSHALPKFNQSEQQMFRSHVIVIESVGLFPSQGQNLLRSGSKIIHTLSLLLSLSVIILPKSGGVSPFNFERMISALKRIPLFRR